MALPVPIAGSIVGSVECFVLKDKKNINFIQTICFPSEAGTVMRKNKDGTRTAAL